MTLALLPSGPWDGVLEYLSIPQSWEAEDCFLKGAGLAWLLCHLPRHAPFTSSQVLDRWLGVDLTACAEAQQDEAVHSVSPGWQWTEQLRSLPRRPVSWRRELRSTQSFWHCRSIPITFHDQDAPPPASSSSLLPFKCECRLWSKPRLPFCFRIASD